MRATRSFLEFVNLAHENPVFHNCQNQSCCKKKGGEANLARLPLSSKRLSNDLVLDLALPNGFHVSVEPLLRVF